jgi:predicted dehydrogenase
MDRVDRGPVRVGLLGYGLAGSVFHGPLIAAAPGLTLDAIVTSDPTRQALASRNHPDARLLARADDLWAQAASLDLELVVVATPNRFHVPLALAAIEAGLAVVVDKPVAPTAEEARQLVATARERDHPLTVFQNRRWDGDFLTVRRLIEEGALGTVARFESRFERWRPTIEAGWRESGAPGEGGGVLFDLGAHLIDQAIQLFGPVESLYAEVDRRRAGAEVDDDAFVALTHASGTRSHLWMSAAAAQLGPRMRVLGDRAGYTTLPLDVQEDELARGTSPADAGFGVQAPEQWGLLCSEGDMRPVPTERGRYDAFYPAVAAALRDGSPMPVDPADSVRVLELIEAAQRSASIAQAIDLG